MADCLTDLRELLSTSTFVHNDEAPVTLIESTNDGASRRTELTNEFFNQYIANDFSVIPNCAPGRQGSIDGCEHIKLFWSRRTRDYASEWTPIPLSKGMYNLLAPFARIPKDYPRILEQKTAVCVFSQPTLPPDLPFQTRRELRKEYLSFIFQSVLGFGAQTCVSASFTYHFKTRHLYVFMHGVECANYRLFSHAIENGAAKDSALLVPSLVIRLNLEQWTKSLNHWHDRLYWHERALGVRFEEDSDTSKLDFAYLTKDVNAANTRLAYTQWSCKNASKQLDFLDEVAKRYRSQAVNDGISEDEAEDTECLLKEAHDALRSWNSGLQDRAEYLSKRAQGLVQAISSAIAQRDTAINLRVANIGMQEAIKSGEVALRSAQDGKVMRVITVVTMIFLPATFAATFFSTSFFSFNDNLDGQFYSPWLWLYFLVTALLTIAVVLGTMLWMKPAGLRIRGYRRLGLESSSRMTDASTKEML